MNDLPCPVCGRPSDSRIDGKCRECFLASVTLARIPRVIHTAICPVCGAWKRSGSWIESADEMAEKIRDVISRELKTDQSAENIQVSVELISTDPSIYQAHIRVTADIKGGEGASELESEVRIIKETCDACSRLAGGYYESIIQIRAEDRFPDEDEQEMVQELVYEVVDRQHLKGDRLAFISKEVPLPEGLDIYIGSNSTARQVCRMAGERFGCRYAESPSLAGRKDGKDIHRITYSLRLPRFKPGDIINTGGRRVLVRHSGKRTTGLDLGTGLEFSDNTDRLKDSRKIGTVKDAIPVVLLSVEQDTVQVMHPRTYRPVTLKRPAHLTGKGGVELRAIIIGDDIFILP